MIGILLFSVGVMYTPGPVNILSLNTGVQKKFMSVVPFSLGVATSMFFWFLLVGYAGSAIVNEAALPYISAMGVLFTLYLAYKILSSHTDVTGNGGSAFSLSYRDGLLLQLLNPKTFMVVLPVAAVQFPAAGIVGGQIAVWALGLSLLGFGAPLAYAAFGTTAARYVENASCFKYFNIAMGVMLVAVAIDMAWRYIVPVLF
ncbi:transporter [Pseudodesulfovibrio cashew]|uniref:Transporter n=1 Tax=Pseudodesulfovibrio cashew TaxID=2678688 RepID=A0A6I6JLZ0_9BACT|nr:LysE family transporter [Pseudodesulfovibrio cashew]QGY41223.1 transporter [Pseudodesulfovibrio cashew]